MSLYDGFPAQVRNSRSTSISSAAVPALSGSGLRASRFPGARHGQLFPDLRERCHGLSGSVPEHLCGPLGFGSLLLGDRQGTLERVTVSLQRGHTLAQLLKVDSEVLGLIG
jgi:hypothetical protein